MARTPRTTAATARPAEQSAERQSVRVAIKSMNAAERIVTGVVYAPNVLDSHGEFMTAEGVRQMAYDFMAMDFAKAFDVQHDQTAVKMQPVESWIARPGDPEFAEGAWVLSSKIEDDAAWSAVEDGKLNAYSVEIMMVPVAQTVERLVIQNRTGETQPGGDDQHTHFFGVHVGDDGKVTGGATSPGGTDGHVHSISKGSVTDESDGHTHRYEFL